MNERGTHEEKEEGFLMKHRRHGRHAAKSTGNCLSMLAAAVAFGLLNMARRRQRR